MEELEVLQHQEPYQGIDEIINSREDEGICQKK